MDIQSPNLRYTVSKTRPMNQSGKTGVFRSIRIPEGDATVRYTLADLQPGSGDCVQTIINERVQSDTLEGKLAYNRKMIATARGILKLRRTEANRLGRAKYKLVRAKNHGPWRYEEFKHWCAITYAQIANRAGVVDELNKLLEQRASLLQQLHNRHYPERRMETFTTAMSLPDSTVECSCNDASPLYDTLAHRGALCVPGAGVYHTDDNGWAVLHLRHPMSAVGSAYHESGNLSIPKAVLPAVQEAIRLRISWGVRKEAESSTPGYNRFPVRPNYNASVPRIVDPDSNQDDEIVRAQAYSRVLSLHGEQDREFVLARSIGELKDLPETLRGGMEFLKFIGSLRNNPIKAVARLKSLQELASFYLGYKFAIAPTVQDINTVLSNTREYLVEMRRYCVQLAQQADKPTLRVYRRYRAGDYPKYDKDVGFFESDIPTTQIRTSDVVRIAFPRFLPLSRVLIRTPGCVDNPSYDRFALTAANDDLTEQFVTADTRVQAGPPTVWVSSDRTFASVYNDWLFILNSSLKLWQWDGAIPPGTDQNLWTTEPTQHRHRLGITVSRVPPPSPYSEEGDWSCKVGNARVVGAPRPSGYDAPIYLRNLVSGVMYADYATSAIREFMQNRGNPFTRFISATDLLLTMWELAPLSFVLDWFTTSHSLWETLQNLADSYEAPDPIDGVWSTARCELWAALCSLRQAAWSYSSWIPGHDALVSFSKSPSNEAAHALADYYRIAGMSRVDAFGGRRSWTYIQPRWLDVQTSVLLSARRGKFFRTGLYKAKRGELIPSFNWLTSFLRVKLKLNASKLGTLGAMALSWAK